ncbi:MAG: hypothetical protein R3E12_00785 [Candidatus Eisenbacteria bacterium]
MSDEQVAFGLVVGLDYRQQSLDVHELLQRLKEGPPFAQYLQGGEILEWVPRFPRAATTPSPIASTETVS